MNTEKLTDYLILMRFDRPVGIFLLLWPTLWALWIAGEGFPDIKITLIFILGVIIMRSAGCVINDFADRKIDPHVSRTRHRPIASGRVTPKEALMLFAGLGLFAFALVLLLNTLTIALSVIGLLLAALYPFMKRVTSLPQVVLGAAFGWAVPMVFAAQTGAVPTIAWLMLTATVCWATAYDTMYAMVDREDDVKIGVKSTAILFGENDRWMIGLIQGLFLATMLIVGSQAQMRWPYYLGIVLAAALSLYQQFLIREREEEKCFKAFLNNNWLGASIFLGIVLNYWV